MFAVAPKTDCPHLNTLDFAGIEKRLDASLLAEPCLHCGDAKENWLCLECEGVFCSRYVNGHMVAHNGDVGHSVALSFSDGSVWCYACDSYVISPGVERVTRTLGNIKFPDEGKESDEAGAKKLSGIDEDDDEEEEEEEQRAPIEKQVFTYEELVNGLRGTDGGKRFEKVAFMTGAGISVAAGIPDFRTPGTGLYAKVAELGLPYPEAIFSLEYLRNNPALFFKIANGFLTYKAYPVKAHHFIKKMADEKKLFVNYTQNIDGLELDAGVPSELVLQAHGHMRSAHCIECGIEVPVTTFFEYVAREEVCYCTVCPTKATEEEGKASDTSEPVRGIVKPDVVFFGERLPREFLSRMGDIAKADLVFVMGTSLKVWPFANLVDYVAPSVPIVLVNREDPGIDDTAHPLLFLEGDIETNLGKLARDLGWALPRDPAPTSAPASAQKGKMVTPARTVAPKAGTVTPARSGQKASVTLTPASGTKKAATPTGTPGPVSGQKKAVTPSPARVPGRSSRPDSGTPAPYAAPASGLRKAPTSTPSSGEKK